MADKVKTTTYSIRLPEDVRASLQALALAKGLKEGELGRMFIMEKLAETQSGFAALLTECRKLSALTIAALSDTIDIDQAQELVSQHCTPNPTVSS